MIPTPCIRFSVAIAMATLLLALGACSSMRAGGYFEDDGPGKTPADVARIPDALPKSEPLAARGNKPYDVYGKTYAPLASARDYRERGVASWYGKKFHGHSTSSGEPYDMYAMSAAHRTLPLPSYVRVRNLENGRSVVVRVNDRGPFLHNRLIDLSYAAASKLGIVGTGTGLVELEALLPTDEAPAPLAESTPQAHALATMPAAEAVPLPPLASAAPATRQPPAKSPKIFVQVGAFRELENATALRARLERAAFKQVLTLSAVTDNHARLYRVRIGPLANIEEGDRLTEDLTRHGLPDAIMVVE